MYVRFTKGEKFNFVCQEGIPDYVFFIKGLSHTAKMIYGILLSELKRLFFKEEFKVDYSGNLYVEKARSVIGGMMGLCAHTVGRYIKELERYGLLEDNRAGLTNCNRIALMYPSNAKRYYKKDSTSNKNNDTNTTHVEILVDINKDSDIYKAKEILKQLTEEPISNQSINQMLRFCGDGLDELDKAVMDCFGVTPRVGFIPMVMDRLKNKYYNKTTDKAPIKSSKGNSTKKKISQSKFTKTETHDFNIEHLEKMELLSNRLELGDISKEEYNLEVKKLNIYKK